MCFGRYDAPAGARAEGFRVGRGIPPTSPAGPLTPPRERSSPSVLDRRIARRYILRAKDLEGCVMPWDTSVTSLNHILASLYPLQEQSVRVAQDAGVNTSLVAFQPRAIDNWH